MQLSEFGLGILMLVLFIVFYWLNIFVTLRALLAFVGTILVGFSGFIGQALDWLGHHGAQLAGNLLGWAFGPGAAPAAGTLLVLVTGIVFIHDLHPKKTAGKRTGFAGLALAVFLLAGVSQVPALQGIVPGVRHAVQQARTIGR